MLFQALKICKNLLENGRFNLNSSRWKEFGEIDFLFEEHYALATRKNDSIITRGTHYLVF